MQVSNQHLVYINARFLTQPVTGVQRFAIELSLQLKRMLPQVRFVAPGNVLHQDMAKALEVESYGKLKGHLWEQVELPLFLRAHGTPLLLNLCNTAPLFYSNKMVCIHDLAFIHQPAWFSKPFATFYRILIPKVAQGAKKVLTVSEFSKEAIVKHLHLPKEKVAVLHNAVSERFRKAATSNPYGNYMLAVGSLDPRKNLKTLIQAYSLASLPDLKLIIVGASSKIFRDEELRLLVEENKNIILTGYLSDEELVRAYCHARLFVYPSLYEGFGIPPLEAMSCGCATVVSNTTSLPEVCGDASYYINPDSAEDIARAIGFLAKDEVHRQALVEKGYERSRHFTWEGAARKLADIIANAGVD